jgi:RNA polymerase sigma-B factor
MAAPTSAPSRRDGDRGRTREQRAQETDSLLERSHRTADPEARRRLLDNVVLINRGVAEAVASRYRHRGLAMDDLQQVAYEGLVKAVLRFDPTLDKDLLTYAVPTIRGELQRHFRDHGWAVRPPRRVQELQWRVNRCLEELSLELGREPRDVEVRERLGIEVAEYDEAMAAFGCFSPTSLDQPVAETTATLADLVPSTRSETAPTEARAMLTPALKQLPERDRRIVYLRYFEDQTQEEIGKELGVTQMQVSRLLTRILRDLRTALGEAA